MAIKKYSSFINMLFLTNDNKFKLNEQGTYYKHRINGINLYLIHTRFEHKTRVKHTRMPYSISVR